MSICSKQTNCTVTVGCVDNETFVIMTTTTMTLSLFRRVTVSRAITVGTPNDRRLRGVSQSADRTPLRQAACSRCCRRCRPTQFACPTTDHIRLCGRRRRVPPVSEKNCSCRQRLRQLRRHWSSIAEATRRGGVARSLRVLPNDFAANVVALDVNTKSIFRGLTAATAASAGTSIAAVIQALIVSRIDGNLQPPPR